ncbi:hypothetical protein BJY00DRAFT_314698 [Aspergillus carlsbadensis]|nr:hypothetical protein BJY00DRAFT_314698 [Aspergillus carlsbadensis]
MPGNGKRKQRPWGPDEPASSRRAGMRKDPFRHLCWDCASIVLSYLEAQDLARCERVDQGWRRFVHEWMGAVGFYQHFPDLPKSAASTISCTQGRAMVFKKCVIDQAQRQKWSTGSASCAREYTFPGRIFTVKGDFVVCGTDDNLHWQHLGFQSDGTLRPVHTLNYKPKGRISRINLHEAGYVFLEIACAVNQLSSPRDTTRFLPFSPATGEAYTQVMVSLETGQELWRQPMDFDHQLIALGADRLYFYSSGAQEGSLIARDLRSGELLYETRHGHDEVSQVEAIIVRQPNGEELIVKQWITHETHEHHPVFGIRTPFWDNHGVRVFRGDNGQCIQTIETEDNFPIVSPNKQGFALLGCFFDHHNRWYQTIHKYRYVAEEQRFQHETSEILREGPEFIAGHHNCIDFRSIDPYGYKAAAWDPWSEAPYLFSLVPCPAVPDAQKVEGSGGPDQPVDAWRTLGSRQQITLPPRTNAELKTRRPLGGENSGLFPRGGYSVGLADQDRLVYHDSRSNIAYVLDFGFRTPQALGVDKGKNKTTMEI